MKRVTRYSMNMMAAAMLATTALAQSSGATSPGSGQSSTMSSGASSSSSPSAATAGSGADLGASTTSSSTAGSQQDGIARLNGTTYFIKNGQAQKVTDEMKLSEGITARPTGRLTLKNGQDVTLNDGEMVTLDGQTIMVPSTLSSQIGAGAGSASGATRDSSSSIQPRANDPSSAGVGTSTGGGMNQ